MVSYKLFCVIYLSWGAIVLVDKSIKTRLQYGLTNSYKLKRIHLMLFETILVSWEGGSVKLSPH